MPKTAFLPSLLAFFSGTDACLTRVDVFLLLLSLTLFSVLHPSSGLLLVDARALRLVFLLSLGFSVRFGGSLGSPLSFASFVRRSLTCLLSVSSPLAVVACRFGVPPASCFSLPACLFAWEDEMSAWSTAHAPYSSVRACMVCAELWLACLPA